MFCLGLLSLSASAADSRNLGAQATISEGRRVALVIGNGKYPDAPLRNPANDARAIALKLKALGFETILRENISQKEMSRAVTQFGEKLAQGGAMGLFYFAGHGIQARGKNYLVPVDAQITGESSVRSETLDVDVILDQLSNSSLNIVILDACRNNPFERRFRGASGGLVQMDAPKGTLIAYATAPGKVALDGEGKNGTYTAELLKALDEPGLKVEDVFKRVRVSVARATSDQQVPWESSSLTGDFYFRQGANRPAASAEASAAPAAMQDTAIELSYWESAEKRNAAADYAAYLKKYPQGQFVDLARNRLAAGAGDAQLASSAPTAPAIGREGPVVAPALPKEGDFWKYRGSNQNGPDAPTYRVARVSADSIELRYATNANEQITLVLNKDWNPISQLGQTGASDIRFVPFAAHYQFPLEPGKKWRATFRGECGALCSFETNSESEVRGWEKVTVPAGTFNALRIDSRDTFRYVFGMTAHATGSVWLVPELKRPVKFDYTFSGKRIQDYELEAYQVAR